MAGDEDACGVGCVGCAEGVGRDIEVLMGVGAAVGVGAAGVGAAVGVGAGAITVGAGVEAGILRKDTAAVGFRVRPSVVPGVSSSVDDAAGSSMGFSTRA